MKNEATWRSGTSSLKRQLDGHASSSAHWRSPNGHRNSVFRRAGPLVRAGCRTAAAWTRGPALPKRRSASKKLVCVPLRKINVPTLRGILALTGTGSSPFPRKRVCSPCCPLSRNPPRRADNRHSPRSSMLRRERYRSAHADNRPFRTPLSRARTAQTLVQTNYQSRSADNGLLPARQTLSCRRQTLALSRNQRVHADNCRLSLDYERPAARKCCSQVGQRVMQPNHLHLQADNPAVCDFRSLMHTRERELLHGYLLSGSDNRAVAKRASPGDSPPDALSPTIAACSFRQCQHPGEIAAHAFVQMSYADSSAAYAALLPACAFL